MNEQSTGYATIWRNNFDERQQKEIAFDEIYAAQFAHGTEGHNARLVIAKMAKLLDEFWEVEKAEPSDEELTQLAKEAYSAYGAVTDFKNYQGLPMPEWENLTPTIKAAWKAATLSVDRNIR